MIPSPDWKLIAADTWHYIGYKITGYSETESGGTYAVSELPVLAVVRWIPRSDRESKNFRFEVTIGSTNNVSFYFRTIAGAKRHVENYYIQKGKLEG